MKQKITSILCAVLLSFGSAPLFSQSSLIAKWGYTFIPPCGNSTVFDIKTDHNGNHVVTGYISSNAGGQFDLDPSPTGTFPGGTTVYADDFYIATYSPAGSFISAIMLGGPGNDASRSIAIDNANNVIVTGYFNGTVDFDPSLSGTTTATSNGSNDVFLAKYTSAGALVWVKTFGGAQSDIGMRVLTDSQDNIFLSATFSGTMDIDPSPLTTNLISNGATDVCIARFDSNGNLLVGASFGGTGIETADDLIIGPDKKIYAAGVFAGTVDFDPNPASSFTITNNSGPSDSYFCKFDSLMVFQWSKSLVCANVCGIMDINLDNAGNVLLGGHFLSAPIDLDPSPVTNTFAAAGGQSAFIAKYDNNGNFLWGSVHGGNVNPDGNKAVSIWSDNTGMIYSTGYFTGVVDFDPTPSTYTLNNSSTNPSLYYEQYDNAGNFISAKRLTSGGVVSLASHVDSNGDLLFCGSLYAAANMDPTGSNPYFFPFANGCGNFYTGFISKYTYCVLPVVNAVIASSNSLCPTVPLTLTVNGSLNSSTGWSWSRGSCGGTSLGTGTMVAITPTASGLYYVKGIGGCGGSVLGCTSISVTTQDAPTLTLTTTGPSTICPGTNFTLTASGAPTYTWNTGATSAAISASTSAVTIYSVSSTGTTGCVVSKTITINTFSVEPLIRSSVAGQGLDVACKDKNFDIKISGGTGSNWQINCSCIKTFTNNSTEVYLTFTNTSSLGDQTYTVTSKDVNDCDNSQTYTLTIDACTGIKQVNVGAIESRIYPSPAGNTLWVETPVLLSKIKIVNTAGQVVTENMIITPDTKHALNTSDLKPGLYVIELYTRNGLIETRKIIKE